MTPATGLGFAAAWDVQPGDDVLRGGVWHLVLDVDRQGRDAPYYELDAGWVSWQVCGGTQRPTVQPLSPERQAVRRHLLS